MKSLARACALLCALECGVSLHAQVARTNIELPALRKPTAEETAVGQIAGPMFAAMRLRIEIADAIFSGETKPQAALAKLRAETSPSGLKLEPEADFSFAAIDIGNRLVGLGKPAEAAVCFQAAEQSLDAVVKRTANLQAKEKAQYLQKLSFIRGRFLNKPAQARADIEEALALQPDDKNLLRTRDNLERTNGAVFYGQQPKG